MSRQFRPCTHGGESVSCATCVARREKRRINHHRARRLRPESVRDSNLWRMYRIRVADYDALRAAQGNRCAICRIHEDDIDDRHLRGLPRRDGTVAVWARLVVDHCHSSGAIRGLLCPPCNYAVGFFQDDPVRMEAAAQYVRMPPLAGRVDLNVNAETIWET